VPKADIMRRSKITLLDHLVSGHAQRLWHRDAECLGHANDMIVVRWLALKVSDATRRAPAGSRASELMTVSISASL